MLLNKRFEIKTTRLLGLVYNGDVFYQMVGATTFCTRKYHETVWDAIGLTERHAREQPRWAVECTQSLRRDSVIADRIRKALPREQWMCWWHDLRSDETLLFYVKVPWMEQE